MAPQRGRVASHKCAKKRDAEFIRHTKIDIGLPRFIRNCGVRIAPSIQAVILV
jgi:hypothetical protein